MTSRASFAVMNDGLTDELVRVAPKSSSGRWSCDIHPFFVTSGDDGALCIERVPAGEYRLEAWHGCFGLKIQDVTMRKGASVDLIFTHDGNEPELAWKRGAIEASGRGTRRPGCLRPSSTPRSFAGRLPKAA